MPTLTPQREHREASPPFWKSESRVLKVSNRKIRPYVDLKRHESKQCQSFAPCAQHSRQTRALRLRPTPACCTPGATGARDGHAANLLGSLDLPQVPASPCRWKIVEALLLYLATLRAGFVFCRSTLPTKREMAYFIGNAEPPWCVRLKILAGSADCVQGGTQHVFTLNENRTGSLLRAPPPSRSARGGTQQADELAAIIYTAHHRPLQRAMLTHGNLSATPGAEKLLGLAQLGGGCDVLLHACRSFMCMPVCGD